MQDDIDAKRRSIMATMIGVLVLAAPTDDVVVRQRSKPAGTNDRRKERKKARKRRKKNR